MGITSTTGTSSLSSGNDTKRIAIVNTWTYNDLTSGETAGTVKIRYQYSNHLGSASLELNDVGEFVSYQEYFPFGETAYTLGEVSTEYRFTGKERDEFTGLYYFGARYYAPWMFRWMNPDPSGPVDGLNVFVYCTNRPIVMVDPDGRRKRSAASSLKAHWDDFWGMFKLPQKVEDPIAGGISRNTVLDMHGVSANYPTDLGQGTTRVHIGDQLLNMAENNAINLHNRLFESNSSYKEMVQAERYKQYCHEQREKFEAKGDRLKAEAFKAWNKAEGERLDDFLMNTPAVFGFTFHASAMGIMGTYDYENSYNSSIKFSQYVAVASALYGGYGTITAMRGGVPLHRMRTGGLRQKALSRLNAFDFRSRQFGILGNNRGVVTFGKKIKSIELPLEPTTSFENARNRAIKRTGLNGINSKPYVGTLEKSKGFGKIIGRESLDGKIRWRLDWDETKGLHINIEDYSKGKGLNAEKRYIEIPTTGENGEFIPRAESEYVNLIKHLNR